MDPSTLKRREHKIDYTLETIPKVSCNELQKEGIEMGNENILIKEKQLVNIKVKGVGLKMMLIHSM